MNPLDALCPAAQCGDVLALRQALRALHCELEADRLGTPRMQQDGANADADSPLSSPAALHTSSPTPLAGPASTPGASSTPAGGSVEPLTPSRAQWLLSNHEQQALWQKQRALLLAARHGHSACVEALMEEEQAHAFLLDITANGLNIGMSSQASALNAAVRNAHVECVHLLLDGASALARDQSDQTALMLAARDGSEACVAALLPLSDGRAQDVHGRSALMNAAMNAHLGCVRLLLPCSDARQISKTGSTALMNAADTGSLECVRALLPYSDARLRTPRGHSSSGNTALFAAIRNSNWSCADALGPHSDTKEAREVLAEYGPQRFPLTYAFFERETLQESIRREPQELAESGARRI